MYPKNALVFAALFVGSLALPAPEPDMSQFFIHADPDARIVGGAAAAVGSVPYMVALSDGFLIRNFFCGGSLISQRTVLTAAHCIDAIFSRLTGLSSNLRVTVGTNRHNQGGIAYTVSSNVTHQHYVSSTIKNDIGILITTNQVALNSLVATVPINRNFIPGGVRARAAGWGRIGQNQAISSQLLELFVTIVDGQQCIEDMREAAIANNFREPPVEPHIEICTFHSAGHGMCNGDSGSALVEVSTQSQIGVVSWGLPCARGGPDMFVRVSAFVDWLDQHTV